MPITNLKLVSIVAETFVSDRVIREIQRLGATGYTVVAAGGQGARSARAGDRERKNVKIETLVTEQVATKILDLLAAHYLSDYAMIAYVQDAGVIRGEEYT